MSLHCVACGHAIMAHQSPSDCACCRTEDLARFGYWRCPECRHARDFDAHAPWIDVERVSVEDDVLCNDCDYAGSMPFYASPTISTSLVNAGGEHGL